MPADPQLPQVRLGNLAEGGISPPIFALIARGVERRPGLAAGLRGTVELHFHEGYLPVRIDFGGTEILVEDVVYKDRCDLSIKSSMPVLALLTAAPQTGGVPRPTTAAGRAALGHIASGRLGMRGSRALARRLLQLLHV